MAGAYPPGLLDPMAGDGRTLSSYNPSLREKTTDWLRGLLYTDDREGQGKAEYLNRVAETMIPPYALAAGVNDATNSVAQGNYAPAGAQMLAVFAGPMAKTADHAALKLAREMEHAGSDAASIWNKTGWFKGADSKWRFEIDDSNFALKDMATRPVEKFTLFGKADRTISHPNLAAAYGDRLPFEYDLGVSPSRGGSMQSPTYWGVDLPDRGIKAGDVQDFGRIRARGKNADEVKDITLHELQHAVQNTEGFSLGSNVSEEAARLAAARDAELMAQAEAALSPDEARALARYRQLKSEYDGADLIPGDVVIEANDLRKKLRGFEDSLQELRVLRAKGAGGALEGGAIPREAAYDQYKRVAGEVEARNVEKRRRMTPEERRMTPPWVTQDVPFADQLIRGLLDK